MSRRTVRRVLFAIAFVLGTLTAIDSPLRAQPQPAQPQPDRDHEKRIRWWREARFGMFIHWGLYAVPAGEYKGLRSKEIGEWIMSWANIPRAEYEQFASRFDPVKFNAASGSASRETPG